MGLSRLDNFLKSVRGTIIYVDPNSIDATDSIENQGNSLTRPFKTIQRALIEASRFSYQRGLSNDRFNKTTIVLYPGEHVVDNRPGYIPDGANNFKLRNGLSTNDLSPYDLQTQFDLSLDDNALFKLNSVHGGVIVPRGTSIIGMDLRKTIIRPKYVPNPENDNIERSAVFRVTGGCYFWQFTVLDADPNDICYKDYTTNRFVPNFSHHKLTAFEYADGVNDVSINDDFISNYSTDRTDLEMYYEKVGIVYGPSSGREIFPDYPSSSLDIQPKIDEFRIVGSRGTEVGITSIRAGDGSTSTNTITVTLDEVSTQFDTDTPIKIDGVGIAGYDGQFVVFNKLDATNIQYKVQNAPSNPLPTLTGATINVSVDTVTSASPYIFNISVRSVFGMCGCHADGSKASGFKSMMVAQFTGIGLQKDNNAFVKYNTTSGIYEDSTVSGNEALSSNSLARFKPEYSNFHIKTSNDGYIQVVSVFAIGFTNHFLSESGGDQSINNSNSNFGSVALKSSGFRKNAIPRDDTGYITHIIPPKEIESTPKSVEFDSIDVAKVVGAADTSRMYLYNQTNSAVSPDHIVDGFRIGAKDNDTLNVLISNSGVSTSYSARIIMPNTEYSGNEISSKKIFKIGRSSTGINSITSNVVTLESDHNLINGENIRILSENGQLPDGLTHNSVYFAITSGVNANQIKIAQTLNESLSNNEIDINNKGGILTIESRVSDKKSGDLGHPIQYDSNVSQWYVNVATAATEQSLYNAIVGLGSTALGEATSRSFINRTPDERGLIDTVYRYRYVIPANSSITARPPLDGYIIQESNASIGSTDAEVGFLYNPTAQTLSDSTQLRNPRHIADANWSSNTANIITEIPHGLVVGSEVEIINVTSTENTTGIANSAFNGTFTVAGISSTKHFSVSLTTNPGTFTNNTSSRTTSLPYFKRKKTSGTYYIYRTQEIQEYIPNQQDGIYHLLVLNASNSPVVSPFTSFRFSQPIQSLYPQLNRDNPKSDPQAAKSFALSEVIGQVVINEPQNSITKETVSSKLVNYNVGMGLTDISSGAAGTTHTINTSIDHGFNRATGLTITSGGSGYVNGNYYNAQLVGFAGSTTGSHATARITVSGGAISSLKIIDGGSAYGIGNTLSVVGVATTSGNTGAVLTVSSIYSNIGDVVSVNDIAPSSFGQYNTLYRITNVVGPTEISVASASTISPAYTTSIGATATSGNLVLNGKSNSIQTLEYTNSSGIATVTTTDTHGLKVNNKVLIGGFNDKFFNKNLIVKSIVSTTAFTVNPGVSTLTHASAGNAFIYPTTYTSSGGAIVPSNESNNGRNFTIYAGITTSLSAGVTATDTTVSITNVTSLDLNIGDYLLIDSEILRVKSTVTGNPVSVFRGLLGTDRTTHSSGALVKKVKPNPIELRRNSFIRASGHTFEYLGFGPGNYSTAFPERQDRNISPQEEVLAQATKTDGGITIFTAMNADGDFYTGNKKVNSATGQEEVFDAPIPTVTGEDPGVGGVNVGFDVLSPLEASISRSIRVEGGPDNSIISEFDGPVIFNNKITSNSAKGIEANSIFLQGDTTVSRKYSVGLGTPTLAGNAGDIVYNGLPISSQYAGWIFTTNNEWENFGYIGDFEDARVGFASERNFLGVTTMLDFRSGIGATIRTEYNQTAGVGTVFVDASPLNIGISTGLGLSKTFVGVATEINFVGYGITISAVYNNTGIASVTFDATSGAGTSGAPGAPANSIQFNDAGGFGGNSNFTFDGTDVFVGNSVGINSSTPGAKLDIVSTTTEALRIRSTSGSGNIVRVDNINQDSTPFIIDINGRVGINTVTANTALDVKGTASVDRVWIFESNRSNYVGLQVPTLSANYALTLPAVVGTANSVLHTTGGGVLDWVSPNTVVTGIISSTDDVSEGSTNLYFTNERAQDATGSAINTGIQTGITVTYDDNSNSINYNVEPAAAYPFTTRGFNMPF